MGASEITLFSLLRSALDGECSPLPGNVVWEEVYALSIEHGVAAIAVDGLQKLSIKVPQNVMYCWFVQLLSCEHNFKKQLDAINYLSELWTTNGLEIVALKGISFAQYYPIPEHRYSCDFDCYTRYSDNTSAWKLADKIAANNGIIIDSSESKHSRFVVKGVSVENHKNLIGVNGSKDRRVFDSYLQGFLTSTECRKLPDMGVLSPCWLFNALFCIAHAKVHFLEEDGITLRHVLDWIQIRKSEDAKDYLLQFEKDITRFSMRKFYEAIDGVADYVMGDKTDLSKTERMFLDDILAPKDVRHFKSKFKARLNILRMVWDNRWKYKYYSETSAIATMWRYVYGHFFDRAVES